MTAGAKAKGGGMEVQLRIALGQVSADRQPAKNIAAAGDLARRAAVGGAGLLVLPEMFMARPTADNPPAKLAAADGGRFRDALAQIAAENGLFVVAGGWEASTQPGRAFNTLFAFTPRGRLAAAYRKLHLFGRPELAGIRHPGAGCGPAAGDRLRRDPVGVCHLL